MTRETKISLLVGLAFIIVIGILLSDHFRSTQELPAAVLTNVGDAVRRATDSPGTSSPPINFVTPGYTSPNSPVATHDELTQSPPPVVPSRDDSNQVGSDSQASNLTPPPAPAEDHGADAPPADKSLNEVASQNGEPLVPAQMDGRSDASAAPAPSAAPAGPKQYRAQDGDTVSRMAARFLGGNTPANRQAIINANPSLRDDPDMVVVGKVYVIPASADAGDSAPAVIPNSSNTPTAEYFYTVKEGDSLWQIANDQLGDPSAVAAIKSLNESILKGDDHDVVIPGMKLRLPARPVAVNN